MQLSKRAIFSLSLTLLMLVILIGFKVLGSTHKDIYGEYTSEQYLSKEYTQNVPTSYVVITKENKQIFLKENNPIVVNAKTLINKFLNAYLIYNKDSDLYKVKDVFSEKYLKVLIKQNYFEMFKSEAKRENVDQKISNIKAYTIQFDEKTQILTANLSIELDITKLNNGGKKERQLFTATIEVIDNKINNINNQKFITIKEN